MTFWYFLRLSRTFAPFAATARSLHYLRGSKTTIKHADIATQRLDSPQSIPISAALPSS
jgi:hypothetical protein